MSKIRRGCMRCLQGTLCLVLSALRSLLRYCGRGSGYARPCSYTECCRSLSPSHMEQQQGVPSVLTPYRGQIVLFQMCKD